MEGKTKIKINKFCAYTTLALNKGDEGYIDGYIRSEGIVYAMVIANGRVHKIHLNDITVINSN